MIVAQESFSFFSVNRLRKGLEWIAGILVFCAAYLAAQLTWQTVALWTPTMVEPGILFTVPTYEENLLPVSKWQWSNYEDMYKVPKVKAAPPPKEIKINIKLTGLVYIGDESLAMLQIDKKPTKLYSINDPLKDGIVLAKIDVDSIVLRKGDLTRMIPLTKSKTDLFLEVASVPSAPREERTAEERVVPNRGSPPVQEVAIARLPPPQRQEITRFREKITKNPLDAIKDINVNEVKEGNSLLGYSIQYSINPALLRALGLLPTDVILAVNGIPVTEIRRRPDILASLIRVKNYRVVLRRDGKLTTLNIKL